MTHAISASAYQVGRDALKKIDDSTGELQDVNAQAAMALAMTAAQWISDHRPDVAMGVDPKLHLVAVDDVFTLPELEDYGRAGNAVKLCDEAFGELWWCDPEGRVVAHHECLLYATKTVQTTSRRTILLRYNLPDAL